MASGSIKEKKILSGGQMSNLSASYFLRE